MGMSGKILLPRAHPTPFEAYSTRYARPITTQTTTRNPMMTATGDVLATSSVGIETKLLAKWNRMSAQRPNFRKR